MAVADFDTFIKLGKNHAREILLEVRDTLGDDLKEKMPDTKIDKLISKLYLKEPSVNPIATPKPSQSVTATMEPPVIAETPAATRQQLTTVTRRRMPARARCTDVRSGGRWSHDSPRVHLAGGHLAAGPSFTGRPSTTST